MKKKVYVAVFLISSMAIMPTVHTGISKNINNLIKQSRKSYKSIREAVVGIKPLIEEMKNSELSSEDKIALAAQIADTIEDVLKVGVPAMLDSVKSVVKPLSKDVANKLQEITGGIQDMGDALENVARVLRDVQRLTPEIRNIGSKQS